MAKLTFSGDFTLKDVEAWVETNKPSNIEFTQEQFTTYKKLLQSGESETFYKGIEIIYG